MSVPIIGKTQQSLVIDSSVTTCNEIDTPQSGCGIRKWSQSATQGWLQIATIGGACMEFRFQNFCQVQAGRIAGSGATQKGTEEIAGEIIAFLLHL